MTRQHAVPVERSWVARAGFRDSPAIDLAAIERRRLQVWGTMAVLLLALSLALVLTSLWPQLDSTLLDPTTLRLAMVVLSAAFTAYVFEKERALRHITRLVLDEREFRIRLDAQARRLHGLLEEVQAMGAALDLERLVQVILSCALDLTGTSGAMLWAHRHDERPLCRGRGLDDRARAAADGMARQVRDTGAGTVSDGENGGPPIAAVPMASSGTLLGVLAVQLPERPAGTAGIVSALEAFGSHAATAILNAQRYAASRAQRPSSWRTASAWDELGALLGTTETPHGGAHGSVSAETAR